MKFTESQLEAAIIELLETEGYPHVLGETITRQSNEVLIKDDLRAFLARQYAKDGITPSEIEAVLQNGDRRCRVPLGFGYTRSLVALDNYVKKRFF